MEKAELSYLIDPHSIMVVNTKGVLKKLYCPFRVKCIEPVQDIRENTWCYVDYVEQSANEKLLYWIGSKKYSYRHFHIYISF
jgi:hypothetical protein